MATPSVVAIDWPSLLMRGAQRPLGSEGLSIFSRPPQDGNPPINFSGGFPEPAFFPTAELAEIAAEVLQDPQASSALQYGPKEGVPAIVAAVSDVVERRGGRRPEPGEILVTAGSSQAMAIVADVLLDPGDTVVVTRPTFANMIWLANAHQANLMSVAQDAEGLDPEDLERVLTRLAASGTRPKFIYVMPNFHNPAGVTMPMDRRRMTLELAARFGVPIFEDDAYHELSYDGEPLAILYALDRAGLVISAGTFSKLLAPGLRLGWLVAPRPIMSKFVSFKHDSGTSPFSSQIVARYCARHLSARIPELRRFYGAKRDIMAEALRQYLPPDVAWTKPGGGFFIWLKLPPRIDGQRLLEAARQKKVIGLPGNMFMPDGNGWEFLRLSFSQQPAGAIEEGIRRLGDAVASL